MSTQPDYSHIESLEPQAVWRFFAGMCAVPHCSKKEEQIIAHVKQLAAAHKLKMREDSVGNLVLEVPATPGHEQAPLTVLQGHVDMVCEKNSGTVHDFDRDPLKLVLDTVDGAQIVRADGTTLGADNGIGVALALAAATDPKVVHGPLELLCTIDEEMGMTGAKVLAPDFVHGRQMLNLDSEEDDALYIGCAGGCDATLTWRFATKAPPAGSELMRVAVEGLRGGHSGGDIHLNRGNALKLLVQTLATDGLLLAELNGGSKRNAIPREASALLAGPKGTLEALKEKAAQVQREAVKAAGEKQCQIRVEAVAPKQVPAVASSADTQKLLQGLAAIPSGVLAVHPEVPGLVQTSNNLSVITCEVDAAKGTLQLTVQALARSSTDAPLKAAVRQICAIGRLAGAEVETGNEYPGWQPNVNSAMLARAKQVYEELFGAEPNVTAIHAGLECGIIGERLGKMDMVSFGPRIEGAHSPDERVYVASVQKAWKFVVAFLARLAQA